MKKSELTHQFLIGRLSYSPLTGIFRWRSIPQNKQFAGKVAGRRAKDGTGIIIQILDEKWTASRLAVFYMTGVKPVGRVQHRNKNPYDCRYENLKETQHD